jgi:WD40 repeat protein
VLFWPVIEKEPLVLFAKNNGLMLYRALQGEPHSYLIQVNTREIRWSDDKQTLVGIGRPPKQKESVLSFYRRKTPPGLEVIREVPVETYAMEVDISRDNKLLAMAGSGYVELYSLETGEQLWKVPAPESLWSVDISPDSTKVAFGCSYLVIVDIENPERKTTYSKFNNNINRVRFSPSGDAVFVSSYDGRVRIISSDLSNSTGKMLKMLKHGGTANVYEMDFTEDGNLMASVSGDKTVRIWGGKKR